MVNLGNFDEPSEHTRSNWSAIAWLEKALYQGVLVLGQVDARHRRQLRGDVQVHVGTHVLDEQRVVHGLVDKPVALEETQVGQGQMAAVEQLDLHLFIGRDVVGELHADLFQAGRR